MSSWRPTIQASVGPACIPIWSAPATRSALDSVRAVRHVPGSQTGRRFAVWGHSQGGHAALFAAAIAASYAPELELVGVAAAAPVTDLAALIEQPRRNPLWAPLLSYTVWSWSHVFGLDPDLIVPPITRGTVARTARDCLETATELKRLLADAAPLRGLPVRPRVRWHNLLAENAPKAWSGGVPAILVQGDDDPVIAPDVSRDFARKLCGAHVAVRYVTMPGVDHYRVAIRSADAVAGWIADRFARASVPDDCAVME
jgi:acetyl esterase/lipase